MKNFFEKIEALLPSSLLVLFVGAFLTLFYKGALSYAQYIEILKTLIWPTVVLISFLFFRKVFTYLFFSVGEFNFFGAKGTLKDIREVIEERVEERISDEKQREQRDKEIETLLAKVTKAEKSKNHVDAKVEAAQKDTIEVIGMYRKLAEEHFETLKELSEFRRRQDEKDERVYTSKGSVKQKIKAIRNIAEARGWSSPKVDKKE